MELTRGPAIDFRQPSQIWQAGGATVILESLGATVNKINKRSSQTHHYCHCVFTLGRVYFIWVLCYKLTSVSLKVSVLLFVFCLSFFIAFVDSVPFDCLIYVFGSLLLLLCLFAHSNLLCYRLGYACGSWFLLWCLLGGSSGLFSLCSVVLFTRLVFFPCLVSIFMFLLFLLIWVACFLTLYILICFPS